MRGITSKALSNYCKSYVEIIINLLNYFIEIHYIMSQISFWQSEKLSILKYAWSDQGDELPHVWFFKISPCP